MNTLLTDPPLLFCDEPTTGLDSYSAGVVVEKLRQFAASGKVVVCTIHQPASGLFDMFNQVLLVARGRVAFYGDVCDAAKYFNRCWPHIPSVDGDVNESHTSQRRAQLGFSFLGIRSEVDTFPFVIWGHPWRHDYPLASRQPRRLSQWRPAVTKSHLESGEKCYCLSRVVRSRFPGELTHIGHGESHLFEFCLYVTGSHVGWESLDYHFDRFVPGQCERVEFLFEVLQQVPLDSKEYRIDVLRRMRCGSSIPEACILSNGGIMLIDRSNYMSRKGVSYDITGVGLNCPATFNRAEFYASQLAVVPGKEMESQRKIQWLCDEFDRSRYGQELIKLVTQARNERRSIIPCRKESDDLDLQSLLEKCYTSNPEVFCIFARSRCTNQARGIVVSAPGGLGFNSLLGPVLQISVESRPRELSNRVQRNGPRNQPPSSLMVIHPLKKSSRATPRVLAHIYYTSVDSSMTNWACGNEAKVLFSALLVNVAFPD
uniref:(California timema) hypothetical protein n=1 Tax=Timema californicum TaxID=61474 RepID=A0A7R9IZX0_TIMCA|nr:unnamed protein product [Timema californicum]